MQLTMKYNYFLLLCCVAAVQSQPGSDVVNKKVERTIDISTQLVTITCRITVENNGKTPLTGYLVSLDESHRDRVAHITASIAGSGTGKKKSSLQISKQTVDGNELYRVDLGDHKIAAGSVSPVIEVEAVYTQLLTPYPTQILQSERQLVQYNTGNTYFLSPYVTKSQTTKVKLPSGGSIETYSKLKPTSQSETTISYGPYDNIPANSVTPLNVHYENNSPFLVATSLDRTIEISHWAGLLSVEEVTDIKHAGAQLKGSFSRYEYQREPTNGISAVKSLKAKLPVTAQDIYYRDDIGNISTSNVRKTSGSVLAELRPRFPLFGGWKTHYTLGYYLPTANYLFNDGNQFVLRIPFIGHLFDNAVVENAVVRVVLPEGASDIKVRLPFSATREKDEVRKTYLDTFGRPVVILRKQNLVDKHIQDFEVHYTFNRLLMLQEPLLLVLALFILCVLVMISVRIDVSLTSSKKPTSEPVVEREVSGKAKQNKKTH